MHTEKTDIDEVVDMRRDENKNNNCYDNDNCTNRLGDRYEAKKSLQCVASAAVVWPVL